MSTLPAAILTMAVLAAAGALPVLALVGPRWQAVPLAPLTGAVIAAAAGACCLAVAGTVLTWFVILAALAAAVTIAWRLPRGRAGRLGPAGAGGPPDRAVPAGSGTSAAARRVSAVVGALVVLGTVAWSLRPLRVPSTGWDARAIWLMRASWFAAGHRAVLAAFRNPLLLLAHASYPPLVSATVAVSWQITGNHSDRLGVVVISLLNGCAVAAAAWVLVEGGRVAAGRAHGRPRRPTVPLLVGVVAAGLFVLATFGVFGPFATNGYADPLWSVAAVGAIGYGLLLPWRRVNLASAAILVGVSGLTKVEGTATAMAIVGLLAARAVLGAWSARRRPVGRHAARGDAPGAGVAVGADGAGDAAGEAGEQRGAVAHAARGSGRFALAREVALRPVLAGVAGIAALAVWPVLTRVEHTMPDVNTTGTRQGTMLSRTRLTADAMAPHLHVLLFAVPLALVAGVLLTRGRRSCGLGNDLWAWAGLVAGLLAVGGAYVTGPGDTADWLLTSVHRTTMFPAIAAWFIVAAWAIVAASGRPRADETPVP